MLRIYVVLFLALGLICAAEDQIPELKLTDGTVFKNVTIGRIEPDGLRIEHEDGFSKVPVETLPAEIRERIGFDPKKASDYRAATNAATAVRMTANANAAQREARFNRWTEEITRIKTKALHMQGDAARSGLSKDLDVEVKHLVGILQDQLSGVRALISMLEQNGYTAEKSQRVIDAIWEKKVFIEMPSLAVLLSWGKPASVNRTVTGRGSSEQWVYRKEGAYVYIENGVVSSIQY